VTTVRRIEGTTLTSTFAILTSARAFAGAARMSAQRQSISRRGPARAELGRTQIRDGQGAGGFESAADLRGGGVLV
jgi:hypothetical protein